jgi:hypothetical protein
MTSSYQSEYQSEDFDGVGLSSSISNLDVGKFMSNIVRTHRDRDEKEEEGEKYYQLV